MNKKTFIIFAIISVFSMYSLSKTIGDIYQKSKRIKDIKNEVASLEKENEGLSKELAYKSSREFVEKEAREKLFMGFPGEKILIIPQNFFANLENKTVPKSAEDETPKPVWKQWVDVFTQ
ncbi:MAG: septum formation initiator family protein [Patescibacteria group bacterium]|nr:septum formation initiator family protein [Patescibacteria group bacterium]